MLMSQPSSLVHKPPMFILMLMLSSKWGPEHAYHAHEWSDVVDDLLSFKLKSLVRMLSVHL